MKLDKTVKLSEREKEVLALLCQGLTNKEIANKLIVVVDTIKRHISSIMFKLNVKNRTQVVVKVMKEGF